MNKFEKEILDGVDHSKDMSVFENSLIYRLDQMNKWLYKINSNLDNLVSSSISYDEEGNKFTITQAIDAIRSEIKFGDTWRN